RPRDCQERPRGGGRLPGHRRARHRPLGCTGGVGVRALARPLRCTEGQAYSALIVAVVTTVVVVLGVPPALRGRRLPAPAAPTAGCTWPPTTAPPAGGPVPQPCSPSGPTGAWPGATS